MVVGKGVTIKSLALNKFFLVRWFMSTCELEKEVARNRAKKRQQPDQAQLDDELNPRINTASLD